MLLGASTAFAAERQSGVAKPAATRTTTTEATYSDQWGPAVGTRLPLLAAADQSGTRRALGDLVGRKGLLLVLVRSADW
ncbi:MAG: hypothetical protein AB8B93_10250 [Pseudomonadales bacterium]